jgi:hypothetical protein
MMWLAITRRPMKTVTSTFQSETCREWLEVRRLPHRGQWSALLRSRPLRFELVARQNEQT